MWYVVEVLLLVHHSTKTYAQCNNDGNSLLPCLSFSKSTWTSNADQLSALPRTVTEGDDHSLAALETTAMA